MRRKKINKMSSSLTLAINTDIKERMQSVVDRGHYDSDSDFIRQAIIDKLQIEEEKFHVEGNNG